MMKRFLIIAMLAAAALAPFPQSALTHSYLNLGLTQEDPQHVPGKRSSTPAPMTTGFADLYAWAEAWTPSAAANPWHNDPNSVMLGKVGEFAEWSGWGRVEVKRTSMWLPYRRQPIPLWSVESDAEGPLKPLEQKGPANIYLVVQRVEKKLFAQLPGEATPFSLNKMAGVFLTGGSSHGGVPPAGITFPVGPGLLPRGEHNVITKAYGIDASLPLIIHWRAQLDTNGDGYLELWERTLWSQHARAWGIFEGANFDAEHRTHTDSGTAPLHDK